MTITTETTAILNWVAGWLKSYRADASRFYATASSLAEMLFALKAADGALYQRALPRAMAYLTATHQADLANRLAVAEEEAGMFGVVFYR